ncbi:uncharacterized protein LOC107640158 [Arachis ipaensis]|uniref:uncharacterized protein LOC107640158 n=1 Tax=Arachis ipaensis TaxID=130454 RepID=UPI0007AF0A77|nr:uncharacterized protein LOC107640158 [Arachis ipaensis]
MEDVGYGVCDTCSMSVLINGSPSKPFKMERGLRQGDPLSPFLFVLVVDVLHRMLEEIVRNGRLSPLLVGRDHIQLSHLQFADDTILFCPPEDETIKNYKRLLRCFELMSGLSINFEKSSLIPINCDEEWVRRMCNVLGCKQDSLPVRYLGISLGANLRLVKTWKPVIDKVEEKLSLWKAKALLGFKPKRISDWGLWVLEWVILDMELPMETRTVPIGVGSSEPASQHFKNSQTCTWVLQVDMAPEDISSYSFTISIWKGLVPPRVELFVWFGLIGRVNTKERLRRQVWCAWISHIGLQWVYPGTIKEHFQSWTEFSINREEHKRLMVLIPFVVDGNAEDDRGFYG